MPIEKDESLFYFTQKQTKFYFTQKYTNNKNGGV